MKTRVVTLNISNQVSTVKTDYRLSIKIITHISTGAYGIHLFLLCVCSE